MKMVTGCNGTEATRCRRRRRRCLRRARSRAATLLPTLGAAVLAVLAWGAWDHHARTAPGARGERVTVERIRSLSELTTLRVQTADVQVTHLGGHTGGARAMLVVRGEVGIGVDLARATFERVDTATRTAVLLLPEPRVHSVRLDHERTKLVALWDSGLWTIVPGGNGADAAVVNAAYRDAERLLAKAAQDASFVERSKAHADRVLCSFLKALGWQAEVRWTN